MDWSGAATAACASNAAANIPAKPHRRKDAALRSATFRTPPAGDRRERDYRPMTDPRPARHPSNCTMLGYAQKNQDCAGAPAAYATPLQGAHPRPALETSLPRDWFRVARKKGATGYRRPPPGKPTRSATDAMAVLQVFVAPTVWLRCGATVVRTA